MEGHEGGAVLGEEDVRQMKVADLKAELAARGQPVSGKKEELVERLLAVLAGSTAEHVSAGEDGNAARSSAPTENTVAHGAAGTTACALGADPMSLERMRARQARFGVSVSTHMAVLEDSAARERRKERFAPQN